MQPTQNAARLISGVMVINKNPKISELLNSINFNNSVDQFVQVESKQGVA
jgi:hypothetical protein